MKPIHAVPFTLAGRVFLPVHLDGRGPYCFLLDTGAVGYIPSLSHALAATLDVDKLGPPYVRARTFAIGDAVWPDQPMEPFDHTAVSKMVGREFDGIVGNRQLAKLCETYDLVMDYPARSLAFHAPGTVEANVPVEIQTGYTVLPVIVNGHGPYRFVLDTGSSVTYVSPEVAADLSLPRGETRDVHWLAASLKGQSSSATVAVGNVSMQDALIALVDCRLLCEYARTQVDGCLGNDLLCQLVVTFRYRDGQMGFGPAQQHQG